MRSTARCTSSAKALPSPERRLSYQTAARSRSALALRENRARALPWGTTRPKCGFDLCEDVLGGNQFRPARFEFLEPALDLCLPGGTKLSVGAAVEALQNLSSDGCAFCRAELEGGFEDLFGLRHATNFTAWGFPAPRATRSGLGGGVQSPRNDLGCPRASRCVLHGQRMRSNGNNDSRAWRATPGASSAVVSDSVSLGVPVSVPSSAPTKAGR